MSRILCSLFVAATLCLLHAQPAWEQLGESYHLSADSAVDREGNVYITDNRNDRICKIDLKGKVTTWKRGTGGAHGIAWGPDGRLYVGQHDRKRIAAYSITDGAEIVMAEGVQSHHLTVTARNRVYVSDPPKRKIWMIDGRGVTSVALENTTLTWPRIVRALPDPSKVAVNDPRTEWIWTFDVRPSDGALINGKPFYQVDTRGGKLEAVDIGGMAFDSKGFLYVATNFGVQVFDPRAKLVETLSGPESARRGDIARGVNDVFFAGPGLRWMYVTDGDRIFRRPAKTPGFVVPVARAR
jgi:gluconolactonase